MINRKKTDRIEKEQSKLMLTAFFAFVNCIINKYIEYKRLEKLVLVFFFL